VVTEEKAERVEISHNSNNPCFYLLNPSFISRSKKNCLAGQKPLPVFLLGPHSFPFIVPAL